MTEDILTHIRWSCSQFLPLCGHKYLRAGLFLAQRGWPAQGFNEEGRAYRGEEGGSFKLQVVLALARLVNDDR